MKALDGLERFSQRYKRNPDLPTRGRTVLTPDPEGEWVRLSDVLNALRDVDGQVEERLLSDEAVEALAREQHPNYSRYGQKKQMAANWDALQLLGKVRAALSQPQAGEEEEADEMPHWLEVDDSSGGKMGRRPPAAQPKSNEEQGE